MNDAERWLEDWHDRHAGATSRAFARGRPSSYEWLASFARPGDRVLDLACGDGLLIEMLLARGVARAAGIDISTGELAAARARLGPAGPLVRARAQALPFASAGFDLVTCHLAFMLMNPVDAVVAEVHRVLGPGGRFAAIVGPGRAQRPDSAWAELSRRLATIEWVGPRLLEPRAYGEPGLRELLRGFTDVRIEPLLVDLSGCPDDLWALFVDMYNHDMLQPDTLALFEKEVRAAWKKHADRGSSALSCTFQFLAVSAVRPPP